MNYGNGASDFLKSLQGTQDTTPAEAPKVAPVAPAAPAAPTAPKASRRVKARDMWRNPSKHEYLKVQTVGGAYSYGFLGYGVESDDSPVMQDGDDAQTEMETRDADDVLAGFFPGQAFLPAGQGKTSTHAVSCAYLPEGVTLTMINKKLPELSSKVGCTVTALEVEPGVVALLTPRAKHAVVRFGDLQNEVSYKLPAGKGVWACVGATPGIREEEEEEGTVRIVSDTPVLVNLQSAPHTLVAGTTGSGKSSVLTSMMLSLCDWYHDTVRIYAVDPKRVTFSNLKHFTALRRIAYTPKEALNLFRSVARVMDIRFRQLEAEGQTSIETSMEEYNKNPEAGAPKYPYVFIFADEFADVMLQDRTTALEFENLACRIAQMGRAAGVHLIMATQKPIAKIVTPLLKGNLPGRIGLRTFTGAESRVVLDAQGCETLKGNGHAIIKGLQTVKLNLGSMVTMPEGSKIQCSYAEPGFPEQFADSEPNTDQAYEDQKAVTHDLAKRRLGG